MTISTRKSMRRILAILITFTLILSPTLAHATELEPSNNNSNNTTFLEELAHIEAALDVLQTRRDGYILEITYFETRQADLITRIENFEQQTPEAYTPEPELEVPAGATPSEQTPPADNPPDKSLVDDDTVSASNATERDADEASESKVCDAVADKEIDIDGFHETFNGELFDDNFEDYATVDNSDGEESTSFFASVIGFFITPTFALEATEYDFGSQPMIATNSSTLEELKAELATVIASLEKYNGKLAAVNIEIAAYELERNRILVALGELVPIIEVAMSTDLRSGQGFRQYASLGLEVVFTITITNSGTGYANDLLVSGQLHNFLTILSTDVEDEIDGATIVGGAITNPLGVAIDAIAPNTTVRFTITTQVIGETMNAYAIDNSVTVSGEGFVSSSCSVSFNILPPNSANLRLEKTADRNRVPTGQLVEYTIRVTNVGDAVAGTVKVIDVLPSGLQFVSTNAEEVLRERGVEDFEVSFNANTRELRVIFESLEVNAYVEFTVTARVTLNRAERLVNRVEAWYCKTHIHDIDEAPIDVIPRQPGDNGGYYGSAQWPRPQPDNVVRDSDADAILRDDEDDVTLIPDFVVPLVGMDDYGYGYDDYRERIVPVGYVPQTDATGNGAGLMLLSLLAFITLAVIGKKRKTG